MLKNMLILFLLSLSVIVGLANPASEDPNINVTPLNKILQIEDGFLVTSTEWSPDGQYLLVTYSKWVPPSTNIVRHYLLDTNSLVIG